ncbi:LysR family transcriptional regulator [Sciscionella marina]|uniref:LysR family transcriptional regulator n=1 Tax=Sciscionella marina TaxID=508770 RepID=UPI0004772B1E|nr:LysR family transcriptional regulator [Sciscionella marina]
MTPTQLRAFAAVVRLGSVRRAAAELGVSEAAVSLHVGQLRKELSDELFTRANSGLAFTPGGLRLARRAAEMLSLQERTVVEVSQAGHGRRLLRVGASSLFAEHAAPGLIEAFTARAADLDVELAAHSPEQLPGLLHTRTVDVALGPRPAVVDAGVVYRPFLNYQMVPVAAAEHPLAAGQADPARLREQTWLLGPSAASEVGTVADVLRQLGIPEGRQRIFQSHAAALEEVKRGHGVTLALAFTVRPDLSRGTLVSVGGGALCWNGAWHTAVLADSGAPAAASELVRFLSTPRATQAMVRGPGVHAGRFRPAVHVTLWS